MPEEPTPPTDANAAADEAWTDDSSYQELEVSSSGETIEDESLDEVWDTTALDWEEDIVEPTAEPAAPPTTQEALAWLKPWLRRFRSSWKRLIVGVRNRIPAASNLSDGIISAILIGLLGLLLVLVNSVRQPSGAVEPPSPAAEPIETSTPLAEPTAEPPSQVVAVPTAPAEEAPPPENPVDIERIAKIQTQLTDSSIYNASRVIDSVQADFAHNRLTLTFNDDWFRLSDYDQALLANQLMKQSADLSFEDLQLQTTDGDLIARNPVIGDDMIIFLRERPPEVVPPERPRYRLTIDR